MRSCTFPWLWGGQTRVGGIPRANEDLSPPAAISSPSCFPSVGWLCTGFFRGKGLGDVTYATACPQGVIAGEGLKALGAWG